MAEIVRIGDREYKKRGPIAIWFIALVTLGVYFFVWYYKINDETRRYLRDDSIRPWHSVLPLRSAVRVFDLAGRRCCT